MSLLIWDWAKLIVMIICTGFRNVLVQKNDDNVAVMTSLNLSKKSGVIVAFPIYNGKMDAKIDLMHIYTCMNSCFEGSLWYHDTNWETDFSEIQWSWQYFFTNLFHHLLSHTSCLCYNLLVSTNSSTLLISFRMSDIFLIWEKFECKNQLNHGIPWNVMISHILQFIRVCNSFILLILLLNLGYWIKSLGLQLFVFICNDLCFIL